MRMLIAMVFGCALMFGVNRAASSGPTVHEGQLPTQGATSADEGGLDDASQGRCPNAPSCTQASQCPADFCAGGALACFQGCCSCAS